MFWNFCEYYKLQLKEFRVIGYSEVILFHLILKIPRRYSKGHPTQPICRWLSVKKIEKKMFSYLTFDAEHLNGRQRAIC